MTQPMFNPTRLDLAMRRRGMPRYETAASVNIRLPALTAILAGKAEPDNALVDKLARLLDFPREFFFGPTLEEPPNLGHYG